MNNSTRPANTITRLTSSVVYYSAVAEQAHVVGAVLRLESSGFVFVAK